MDQLEAWAVRGRVATAVRGVREAMASLAITSKELRDAMAEAAQLGIDDDTMPQRESQHAAA